LKERFLGDGNGLWCVISWWVRATPHDIRQRELTMIFTTRHPGGSIPSEV
jgi:hypothetical protein